MNNQETHPQYITEQELQEHFSRIEMPRTSVEQLKTPLFRPSVVQLATEVLAFHNITTEVRKDCCLICFPEGTYKTELLPRLPHVERYKIVLPDAYELHEVHHDGDDFSYLQIAVQGSPA